MTIATRRLLSLDPAIGRASGVTIFASALAYLVTCASAPALAAGITVEKPWMRFIVKTSPAGGYFTVRNDTDTAVELTGAASSGCGMLTMHRTKEESGVEKMLPVKSVTVPAHGSASFAPGGYHLMCMQPQNTMAIGKSVPVTLTFADGKTLTADFPVKGPGG